MGFNIDNDKVIGIIDHEKGGRSARIKVIGILKKNNKPINLTEKDAEQYFPPKGFIFEPGFFYNFKHQENEIVSFYIDDNEKAESGQDKYRLKVNASEIKNYGLNARRIIGFKRNNLSTDLSLIKVEKDTSDGKFFGITDKYIIGELRLKKGEIEPALHRRITFWDFEEENILSYNGQVKLHHFPNGDSMVLDCMDDKQLFDWFRNALKTIEPDYVSLLDKKAKWRIEIPKLFSEADKQRYEVDRIRFERIKEKFSFLDLSVSDIRDLIEKSDSLREAFINAIETHKEEFKGEYENRIEEYHKGFEEKKELLDKELNIIQNSKKEKVAILNSLEKEIEISIKKIENLNQNKERILADFSIIKDVLSIESNNGKSISKQTNSFILESIEKLDDVTLFPSREEFITELKYQLNKFQLFPNFSERLLYIMSIYKGIFLKDIRLGVAFAEATKNTKYIIQQVEPDWLHFSNFWNNGLGAIWQSAHNHPDILHFLFLEDINLSSPECYARPLFDLINGIRKHIPYGGTPYPENLKILATKASTIESEIGLPLIEQTFEGWGAVGFNGNIYKKEDNEFESLSGFINTELLYRFQPDEFEIENIKSDVKRDFSNLFETE